MAERSVTVLPDVVPPMKKLQLLPAVLFWGLSRERNKPLKRLIECLLVESVKECILFGIIRSNRTASVWALLFVNRILSYT